MATITEHVLATFGSVPAGLLGAAFNSCGGMFTMKEAHTLTETCTALEQGIMPRIMHLRRSGYSYPRLSCAIIYVKDVARVEKLLDMGADPFRPTWNGKTALHHAVSMGCLETVRLLLARFPELLFHSDAHGDLPIFDAIRHIAWDNISVEIFWELLAQDPDQMYAFDGHGRTLLHAACDSYGHVDVDFIAALLEMCPEMIHQKTSAGDTPLSIILGHDPEPSLLPIISLLIQADPSSIWVKDGNGYIPRTIAIYAYQCMREADESMAGPEYDLGTQREIIQLLEDAMEAHPLPATD